MKHENELLIPPAAEEDPKALEVIRVWVAKGGQHVSARSPTCWWRSSPILQTTPAAGCRIRVHRIANIKILKHLE